MEDVDTVLRVYHTAILNGDMMVGERAVFDRLLERHRESSMPRGREVTVA